MKLQELLRQEVCPPMFQSYALQSQLPPLDVGKLNIHRHYGDERGCFAIPHEGDASFLLRYKGKEAALSSVSESVCGELWTLLQLQGAKGKTGYRVSNGLSWHRFLADTIRAHALHPEAEVQRLAMPPVFQVTNLVDSPSYDNARTRYQIVMQHLGMRYSDQERLHIVDLSKATKSRLEGVLH